MLVSCPGSFGALRREGRASCLPNPCPVATVKRGTSFRLARAGLGENQSKVMCELAVCEVEPGPCVDPISHSSADSSRPHVSTEGLFSIYLAFFMARQILSPIVPIH